LEALDAFEAFVALDAFDALDAFVAFVAFVAFTAFVASAADLALFFALDALFLQSVLLAIFRFLLKIRFLGTLQLSRFYFFVAKIVSTIFLKIFLIFIDF
jgi:hypothetical protein